MKKGFMKGQELLVRWRIDKGELLEIIKNGQLTDIDSYYEKLDKNEAYILQVFHPSHKPIKIYDGPKISIPIPKVGQIPLAVWDVVELYDFLDECLFKFSEVEKVEKIKPYLKKNKSLEYSNYPQLPELQSTQQERKVSEKNKLGNFLINEGAYWHIGFEGKNTRIKHIDGLLYIGYLLDQLQGAGKSISCRELYHAALKKMPDMTIPEDEAKAQDLSVSTTRQAIGTGKARKICLAQYEKLQEKLLTANRREEQEDIKEKMDKLKPYLILKARNFADPNDKKVQSNINKRLKTAYKAIVKAGMKELEKHLRDHIKPDNAYGLSYTGFIKWEITSK